MKHLYYKFGAWLSITSLALLPAVVSAQLTASNNAASPLGKVGVNVGASHENNLPTLIGKFINAFLSVLGILFVVLVVYAGYLWMTDMGAGDKIKTAKKLLGTAIIGLVLTIAAYAISTFVIDTIVTASALVNGK